MTKQQEIKQLCLELQKEVDKMPINPNYITSNYAILHVLCTLQELVNSLKVRIAH